MKRYTGQQALYEAISRSQAKARRGGILEKLRARPPGEEPKPPMEQPPAADEASRPCAKEPAKSTAKERLRQALAKKSTPAEKPVDKSERPIVKARLGERIDDGPEQHRPPRPLLRPKALQLNAGRVEVSVPYHVGVAAALAMVVVVLGAFRIGQEYPAEQVRADVPTGPPVRSAPQNAATMTTSRPRPAPSAAGLRVAEPAPAQPPLQARTAPQGQGDHLLVLARARQQEDLAPVIKFFGDNGVELMPLPLNDATRRLFTENGFDAAALGSGDGYLLIAKYLYHNPEREGTDGYAMRMKIIDLGEKYKAQPGSQMFAPHYFRDTYGTKVKK
jgi:hypothetical protein